LSLAELVTAGQYPVQKRNGELNLKSGDNESCGTDENQEVIPKPRQSDDKSPKGKWEGKPKFFRKWKTAVGGNEPGSQELSGDSTAKKEPNFNQDYGYWMNTMRLMKTTPASDDKSSKGKWEGLPEIPKRLNPQQGTFRGVKRPGLKKQKCQCKPKSWKWQQGENTTEKVSLPPVILIITGLKQPKPKGNETISLNPKGYQWLNGNSQGYNRNSEKRMKIAKILKQ
jgi:hypothetical protein